MAKNVKPDVVLKRFWSDNEHFADLFNAVVFNGEQILNPECLEERNVTEAELIEWKDKGKTIERMRDIVKKSAFGVDFVILGIENQMKVHYGMPLRVMLYDGLQYLNECNEIIKAHKKEKEIGERDEFLSGIKKDDRIHPVITVVIYYNENEWDGPTSLHDMMIMPEQIKPLVYNYGMHLVQVRSSDGYLFRNKEVKTVFNISCKIYNKKYEDLK